jgi:hypothetical protein
VDPSCASFTLLRNWAVHQIQFSAFAALVDGSRAFTRRPLNIHKAPRRYSAAEHKGIPLKDIAIIVAFGALTATPPIIAGLHAPPSAPESATADYSKANPFSLSGALCIARSPRPTTASANNTLSPEQTPVGAEETITPVAPTLLERYRR